MTRRWYQCRNVTFSYIQRKRRKINKKMRNFLQVLTLLFSTEWIPFSCTIAKTGVFTTASVLRKWSSFSSTYLTLIRFIHLTETTENLIRWILEKREGDIHTYNVRDPSIITLFSRRRTSSCWPRCRPSHRRRWTCRRARLGRRRVRRTRRDRRRRVRRRRTRRP